MTLIQPLFAFALIFIPLSSGAPCCGACGVTILLAPWEPSRSTAASIHSEDTHGTNQTRGHRPRRERKSGRAFGRTGADGAQQSDPPWPAVLRGLEDQGIADPARRGRARADGRAAEPAAAAVGHGAAHFGSASRERGDAQSHAGKGAGTVQEERRRRGRNVRARRPPPDDAPY